MSGIEDQPPTLNDKTVETPGSSRGNIILAQDDLILNLTKQIQILSDELATIKGQAPQNAPSNANPIHNAPTYQSNPLNQTPPPPNRPQVSQNTPPAQQNTQPVGYPSYYPYPNDPTPPHYQYLPAKDTPRPPQSQAPIDVAVAPPNANDPRQGYPESLYYEHDPNGKNVDFTEYAPQNEVPVTVEKQGKTSGQEEIIQAMKIMQQSIKDLQVTKKRQGASYRSRYLYPDITPPPGFKVPKFDMYDGHGDPFAHLTKYLNRMRVAGGKEELLMAYFLHSLEGIAAEWFARQDISKWHEFDDIADDFTKQFEYNVAMEVSGFSLNEYLFSCEEVELVES